MRESKRILAIAVCNVVKDEFQLTDFTPGGPSFRGFCERVGLDLSEFPYTTRLFLQ